jgi:hypothetical protein
VIVTAVFVGPKFGEKPDTTGWTTKLLLEKLEPAGVVTRISPVIAFVGTAATIVLLLRTKELGAATPLKLTDIAPTKFAPLITMLVPVRPAVGEKPVMPGGTKKFEVVIHFPRAELTTSGPVETLAGVSTRIKVSL